MNSSEIAHLLSLRVVLTDEVIDAVLEELSAFAERDGSIGLPLTLDEHRALCRQIVRDGLRPLSGV